MTDRDLTNQFATQPLTEREQEVLQYMAGGLSIREIAERMVVALNTVKWYVRCVHPFRQHGYGFFVLDLLIEMPPEKQWAAIKELGEWGSDRMTVQLKPPCACRALTYPLPDLGGANWMSPLKLFSPRVHSQ